MSRPARAAAATAGGLLGRAGGRVRGGGRAGLAAAAAAVLVPLGTWGVIALHGGHSSPPSTGVLATTVSLPTPSPTPEPTPTPTPTPAPTTAPPAQSSTGGGGGHSTAPSYPLMAHLDAPSVGVHVPVVAVGIVRGAMDAPEGPLGSPFWREGFWLREGAMPGTPGVATIAGHLDDTAGRPAAFWNVRNLHSGDVFTITRASDGAVLTYQIVETDVWSLSTANSKANLQRIYGPSSDGLSRVTLITCTGHWNGYEYDHRFVAFAVLQNQPGG